MVVLTVIPAALWARYSSNPQVKGIQSEQIQNDNGFSVFITSTTSGWELHQYLCDSVEECEESTYSGVEFSRFVGQESQEHEVIVDYNFKFEDYNYLKMFVLPSWRSSLESFEVLDIGQVPETKQVQFKEDSETVDAVIIDLDQVKNNYYKSVSFSN